MPEKEKIKDIIEDYVRFKPLTKEEYKEYQTAYQRQKFYQALKSDDFFREYYKKYKKITKKDNIKLSRSRIYIGPGISPLSENEILKISNKELAEKLSIFKPKRSFNKPNINALSTTLKDAVVKEPDKFYNDLKPFIKSPYLYVYYILLGFLEYRNQNKEIGWSKILDFIKEYIESDDFWNDKYKLEDSNDEADHSWIIGCIGELIGNGLREKDFKIQEKDFDKTFDILMSIIEKLDIKNKPDEKRDYVLSAYNSKLGRILDAFILLIWNMSKSKNPDIKNSKNINKFFEKYDILLTEQNIEAYVYLGKYLNCFYSIDKVRTKNYIGNLDTQSEIWEAFMTGCSYNRQLYDELYTLMKDHYIKAIDYNFNNAEVLKNLIKHIVIWYIRDIENIDDREGLFKKMIDKWDAEQINDVINIFWMLREEDNSKKDNKDYKNIQQKIINFWEWIYDNKFKNKANFNKVDQKILSELSKLTIFLDEINKENCEWLKKLAPYIYMNFNYPFFIQYIDELKDKGDNNKVKDYVGKIFLNILNNFAPDYPKENIESIVDFLYKSGNKKDADEICIRYGEYGLEFLRKYFEENNK